MIHEADDHIWFEVMVKTNAPKNELIIKGNFVILKISATPTKGKANKEIIKYLAKCLDISSRKIQIVRGAKSTTKQIRVDSENVPLLIEKLFKFRQVQRRQ